MTAEYFAPREDIILQNETPADFYIIVTGSMFLREKKEISAIAAVTKEIDDMLARGQMDFPITLCFAASKGDSFLLHQLLKRGLDPNESDNYGHTALVH
uniref:Cyclic nucleotide-binding domain-containing protein n=1 Tax=Leersia perrieri TaxID=77586 RepID=A0A0D9WS45_9ORYZ